MRPFACGPAVLSRSTIHAKGDLMEDAVNLARLLSERLGAGAVLTDPADMVRYCRDWHGDVTTGAVAVLRPASTCLLYTSPSPRD